MKLGNFHRRASSSHPESGYFMIVLLIMVALMTIAALATAPQIATQIKRDREQELVHRGAQYARAVKKFYKKFGRYPVSIEQLENTNNIRFLRKRYKDPITGKDFRPLHFGEVQLTPKAPGSATGPGLVPDSAVNQQGPLQSTAEQPTPQSPAAPQSVFSGMPGSGLGSGGFSSGAAGGGPSFGGGPIIGVASTSRKVSLLEFNAKNHYNEWEFIYDPTMDRGGLITGPFVPSKAGIGGVVPGTPGGMTTTTTPQSGFGGFGLSGSQPSSFGQPSVSPQPQQGPK